MLHQIKNRWTGAVLFELECGSLKICLEAGVKAKANLSYANLSAANLRAANLSAADLSAANLSDANLSAAKNMKLPTGETWADYLSQTVPALLTAGGRPLSEVATAEHWNCHDWGNCPMAAAFGVSRIDDVPILYRPRAEQFVRLFDANQIKLKDILPKSTS